MGINQVFDIIDGQIVTFLIVNFLMIFFLTCCSDFWCKRGYPIAENDWGDEDDSDLHDAVSDHEPFMESYDDEPSYTSKRR